MLFDDEDKEAALASRPSPVAKALRSDRAKAKGAGKRTEDGQSAHSFHTLIADLGTLCLNEAIAVPKLCAGDDHSAYAFAAEGAGLAWRVRHRKH